MRWDGVTLTHCCKGLKTFFVEASLRLLGLYFWSSFFSVAPGLSYKREKYRSAASIKASRSKKWAKAKLDLATLIIQRYDLFWRVMVSQCGNFRIFLSLRFYVKSILESWEVPKLLSLQFYGHCSNLVTVSLQKVQKMKTSEPPNLLFKMADFKTPDLSTLISRKIWVT